jgi:hypothetical protein
MNIIYSDFKLTQENGSNCCLNWNFEIVNKNALNNQFVNRMVNILDIFSKLYFHLNKMFLKSER